MTINNDAQAPSTEAPLSSPGGELISTVEYRPAAPATESPADKQDNANDKADDKQTKDDSTSENQDTGKDDTKDTGKAEETDRFDKHPRFRQLNKQNADLKAELAEIKKNLDEVKSRGNKDPDTKKDQQSGDEDNTAIFEKLNSNPKQLLEERDARLRQSIIAEMKAEAEQEITKSQTISDITAYANNNPDTKDGTGFDQMWQSGDLEDFLKSHPGHNFISAHQALTLDKRIEEATKQAVAEATEKLQKQFQAKRNAAVLSGGPASLRVTGGNTNSDLADTKSYGGLTSTLAARLERMRSGG